MGQIVRGGRTGNKPGAERGAGHTSMEALDSGEYRARHPRFDPQTKAFIAKDHQCLYCLSK